MTRSRTRRRRLIRFALITGGSLAIVGTIAAAVLVVHVLRAGASLAAEDYSVPGTARDIGDRYAALAGPDGALDKDRVDAAYQSISAALEGSQIVIVPSYLVDQLALGRTLGLIDYFSDQVAWLAGNGIDAVFADVDTEASVADNGAALRDLVVDSDRPICFVTHSKGGLDTLEALIGLSVPDRVKVRCWIAFQAPFAGTPLADLATGFDLARPMLDEALELLGGSGQSLDDLTTDERQAYLARNDAAIAVIADDIPILAVAARLPESEGLLPETPFAISRWWMGLSDIESDGAVPTGSAILPHARYVVVDGLDHGDTFDADRAFSGAIHDDVLFLEAMLSLVLGGP